jgi:thiol-disulfide isomerase/thioredoxin
VRVAACVALLSLSLAVLGCKTPSGPGAASRPTMEPGLPPRHDWPPTAPGPAAPPPPPPSTPSADSPLAGSGILAGQVLDSYDQKPPQTYIQVTPPRGPGEPAGAPIEVAADANGYFTIQGLQPGKTYQLSARARNGERILAGTTWATPPNPKLLIRISEDFASPNTPPLPPPPVYPGKPEPPPPPVWPEASKGPAGSPRVPATLGTPKSAPAEIGPPRIDDAPTPQPRANVRPQDIALDSNAIARNDSPPVSINSQPANTWTAPGGTPAQGATTALPATPPLERPLPSGSPPPVPSCVLTGNQLHNFALYDLNGRPWEFRQHRGRLVLLDFWGSWCMPCQQAIPHLRILQEQYGRYGLEVIGIAYENDAPMLEQIQKIDRVAQRLRVNYRLLLGSERKSCPVRNQFQIDTFPTLVLLDDAGKIVWRSEGVDPQKWKELEFLVRQRLNLR